MEPTIIDASASAGHTDLAPFVTDNYERLCRLARMICDDPNEAQDAVQAALVLAWRDRGALRELASLRPWIDRIVVREAIRANRRRRPLLAFLSPRARIEPIQPHDPPDTRAWLMPAWSALRIAFDRLSPDQRAALALHLHFGYSIAETAAIVGAPEETVRSRIRLARERLRRELKEDPR